MPFVEFPQRILGFQIKKRLGKPNMCGWSIPGWSECGDDNNFSGVYQARQNRVWNGDGTFTLFGKRKCFQMRPAWPVQPPSVARDAQQAKFKTALLAWQALTDEQKKAYNTIATRRSKRGYDLFMTKTLKSL